MNGQNIDSVMKMVLDRHLLTNQNGFGAMTDGDEWLIIQNGLIQNSRAGRMKRLMESCGKNITLSMAFTSFMELHPE